MESKKEYKISSEILVFVDVDVLESTNILRTVGTDACFQKQKFAKKKKLKIKK
jgi:hypothetical protein